MAAAPEMLRVLARGTALCPPFHQVGHRTPVGRVYHPPTRGWRPKVDPTSVPNTHEFRQVLRERDLWPADEETAEAAGVEFDPTFGGEFGNEGAEQELSGREDETPPPPAPHAPR